MTAEILILIASLAAVVLGADALVDGASALARKAGISEFVIGLTIVGFGTSCPELVVSLTGAIEGNSAVSVGNVMGSNIFNTLLILGISALIMPVSITRTNFRRDIPIALLAAFIMIGVGFSKSFLDLGVDGISRVEALVFLALFALYLYSCFKFDSGSTDCGPVKGWSTVKSVTLIIFGLAALVVGGKFFVDSAVALAAALGVSDKVIAVTILAGGTSLPELVTSVVACFKKKDQLALGNILGSNVFNIFLILGSAALVRPLSFDSISIVDTLAFILSAAVVWLWACTGRRDKIDRWEGAVMIVLFAAYYAILL